MAGSASHSGQEVVPYNSTVRGSERAVSRPTNRLLPAVALIGVLALAGLLVLLVWLLRGFIPGDEPPVVYFPEGRISFVRYSEDGASRDLFVVNPDGTRQEHISNGIVIEGTNLWSPDGRSILLQASVGGTSTVARVDIGPDNRAGEAVQLTADVKADSAFPVWSPDGKQVAFQSKRGGGDFQVFVMDRDGNNKRLVSAGTGYAGHASWSPDGQTLVYAAGENSDAATPKELWIAPTTGGAATQITSMGKPLSSPQWSSNGEQIVVLQGLGDRDRAIIAVNADGSSPRTLVEAGANRGMRVSPTGDRLVYYVVNVPGQAVDSGSTASTSGSDIYTVALTGGAPTNLTPQSTDDYEPSWSPDGRRLTWSGNTSSGFKITVADADGSNALLVSNGEGNDYQPSWGPPVK